MTNVKMTKAEKFTKILEMVQGTNVSFEGFDVVEFLGNEIELVNKRNATKSANRKPSKTQLENEGIVLDIITFLEGKEGEMLSAKEIAEGLGLEVSSQKMTALMKKACEVEGSVTKGKADSNKKLVGYGVTQGE